MRAPRGGRPAVLRAGGRDTRVRELAAQGKSCREISEVLRAEGCQVGRSTVAKFLSEEVADRRVAAQHVAAEEAATTVPLATGAFKETLSINLALLRRTHEAIGADGGLDELTTASRPINRYSQAVVTAARGLLAAGGGESDGQARAFDMREVHAILENKRKREAESEDEKE